ncbi:hypothetical protein ABH19_04715 [Leptospirillum sp. Group II 'CF-1']|nr:hypothetical protein ABH19_04715 [Leptospirillum sp. Group II 'CF-1']
MPGPDPSEREGDFSEIALFQNIRRIFSVQKTDVPVYFLLRSAIHPFKPFEKRRVRAWNDNTDPFPPPPTHPPRTRDGTPFASRDLFQPDHTTTLSKPPLPLTIRKSIFSKTIKRVARVRMTIEKVPRALSVGLVNAFFIASFLLLKDSHKVCHPD